MRHVFQEAFELLSYKVGQFVQSTLDNQNKSKKQQQRRNKVTRNAGEAEEKQSRSCTFRRIMKKPGVLLRLWNSPAHFKRRSMSSSSRSCHVVLPSLHVIRAVCCIPGQTTSLRADISYADQGALTLKQPLSQCRARSKLHLWHTLRRVIHLGRG